MKLIACNKFLGCVRCLNHNAGKMNGPARPDDAVLLRRPSVPPPYVHQHLLFVSIKNIFWSKSHVFMFMACVGLCVATGHSCMFSVTGLFAYLFKKSDVFPFIRLGS